MKAAFDVSINKIKYCGYMIRVIRECGESIQRIRNKFRIKIRIQGNRSCTGSIMYIR